MTDIAPELYAKIQADFKAGVNNNVDVQKFMQKVLKGKAKQIDMHELSRLLGVEASKALKANLVLKTLPDERLYWNIAEKTIQPLLIEAYKNVNAYAIIQQDFEDKRAGIGVEIVKGGRPENRAREVMEMAVNSLTQEELDNALTDPTITAVQKYYDDFQKENAKLRHDLGLKETVVRVYDGKGLKNGTEPCTWCLARAGVWDYETASKNEVFARHPGCGCTIEHHTEKAVIIV